MKTVLLTAVGSASAPAVIQRLRLLGYRVVGCDIYPQFWNAAACEVDAFFQAVYATDADAYVRQMEEAVRREHADFLIPLTDLEVDALCGLKARFAALGCALCVPDEPSARLCRDKRAMADLLSQKGVCRTIPTRSPYGWEPEAADYPLMLKPRSGRSSQGQAIVRTPAAFHAALAARPDYIAQPFLPGDIYTVDVARDRFGHVQALARHELLRTPNGLGTAVRILPGHPLEAVCAEVAACAGVVGVVNMEFIVDGDDAWFLEVNPRFSGGVGFSVLAGLDFPALNLLCHAGESLAPRPALREMTLARRCAPVITSP